MTGTLYVIGIGPGDPELMTLKAVRILREVPCICVPKGREEGSSLALSVVQKAINLEGKEIIEAHFPMKKTKDNGLAATQCELDTKWQGTVEAILGRLVKGINMAFITNGDPTIYSTFFYLYDSLLELNPDLHIEIIPGVSSINAASARAKVSLSLADEKIAILPATYITDIDMLLEQFDSIVLMKVHRVFDKILRTLEQRNLVNKATYIVKAGMKDEKIFKNIKDVKLEDLNYFSVLIIKQ